MACADDDNDADDNVDDNNIMDTVDKNNITDVYNNIDINDPLYKLAMLSKQLDMLLNNNKNQE